MCMDQMGKSEGCTGLFWEPDVGSNRRSEATGEYKDQQKARSGFPERASLNLAPLTGLEPVTYGLTVRRSTD